MIRFNKVKRIIAVSLSAALFTYAPFPATAEDKASEIFYEDFSGSSLDPDKWLIAEKNWGGTVTANGVTEDYNGGVIADNVTLRDGGLVLTGLGNNYDGELRGINRDKTRRADGKRCGGAIATREYYSSGSYEIRAKISPELGCCSAMWTFEYEENYSDDKLSIVNHEIDIEFPGRDDNNDFSLSHVLCTTWLTEDDYRTQSVNCGNQADGEFHTYRFDWHTGSDSEIARVEYYFDGVLKYTATDYIPTNESRFWLGLWFPKNWAGTPDFDQTEFVVDYVRITPFHESGDTPSHESYPDIGWSEKAELPKGWLLWHSYGKYSDLDSTLYLKDPEGKTESVSGDFIHAMNGSFGNSPEVFTFMAIDKDADEWDIFLSEGGRIINLTKNSGCRNEDPKWAPDGKNIVFKRGHWDSQKGDFVYDLALLNVKTHEITMLTSDTSEEAMPCFSSDEKFIYYAGYSDGIGSIYRIDVNSRRSEVIYEEESVTAYYPVAFGDELFFTKWYSAENHCDQIMRYDGRNVSFLPFDSDKYDCSDACPIGGSKIVFSSTMNGDYDLCYYDGRNISVLSEFSSERNELGADFFSYDEYIENNYIMGDVNSDGKLSVADLVMFQKWLLGEPDINIQNWRLADLCRDEKLNMFDLCLLRMTLTER